MTIPAIKKDPKLIYVVVNPEGDVEDYCFHWESDAEQFLIDIQQDYEPTDKASDDQLLMYAEMEGWKIIEVELQ